MTDLPVQTGQMLADPPREHHQPLRGPSSSRRSFDNDLRQQQVSPEQQRPPPQQQQQQQQPNYHQRLDYGFASPGNKNNISSMPYEQEHYPSASPHKHEYRSNYQQYHQNHQQQPSHQYSAQSPSQQYSAQSPSSRATNNNLKNTNINTQIPPPTDNTTTEQAPNNIDLGIPPSSEEWKERGAATLVKSERDEHGQMTTKVIKKGVKDFTFGKTLGEGSYSTVTMASDRQTLRDYAIKVLDKRHIIKEKKVKYVNIEKNTLNRLGVHPGIIRLYYTFQDEQSLYFVLDYAPNGELLSLIKRMGSLDEDCTRYYGAQLLDAVQYMHSKGVVHRDLKPENILLDEKMRIRITDFGTAKLMNAIQSPTDDESAPPRYPEDVRANSFVGTAEYVSPELLTDKATGKASDIWAFGCILYQMIAGRPPFKAANEYQTFQKIVKLQFSYPPGFSMLVREVVKYVLVLKPHNRATIDEIKDMELFEPVDWFDQRSIWKRQPPRLQPFKPQTRSISNPAAKLGVPFRPHHHPPQHQSSQPQIRSAGMGRSTAASNAAALAASKNAVSSATAAAVALKQQPSHRHESPREPPREPSREGHRPESQQRDGHARNVHSSGGGGEVSNGPNMRQALPPLRKSTSHMSSLSNGNQSHPSPTSPPKRAPSYNQLRQPQFQQQQQQQPYQSQQAQQSQTPQSQPQQQPQSSLETQMQQHALSSPTDDRPAKPKLEIPPHTKLDADWNSVLQHYDERVLKVGTVQLITTANSHNNRGNEDDDSDKEPSKFSKFFTGPRRKKRTLLVTSYSRMLIMGSDDKKIRVEIPLSVPQVSVREFAFNKKTNMGTFSVETHNKVYTFEDSRGTGAWIDSIQMAKDLYAQHVSEQNSASFATAAHAAALAAGSGMNKPSSHQNTPQSPQLVDSSSSAFLQRSEERRIKRGR